MGSEFYERLNDAELEYSTSKELFSEEKPLTGDSLVSKLARNVAQLIGDTMNPITMTKVVCVTTDAIIDIKLDQLISAAPAALDQLSEDDLAGFSDYLNRQRR